MSSMNRYEPLFQGDGCYEPLSRREISLSNLVEKYFSLRNCRNFPPSLARGACSTGIRGIEGAVYPSLVHGYCCHLPYHRHRWHSYRVVFKKGNGDEPFIYLDFRSFIFIRSSRMMVFRVQEREEGEKVRRCFKKERGGRSPRFGWCYNSSSCSGNSLLQTDWTSWSASTMRSTRWGIVIETSRCIIRPVLGVIKDDLTYCSLVV